MTDRFHDKAAGWDDRPVPLQISDGVFAAMDAVVDWSPNQTVMDFGAGTGLVAGRIAPHVGKLLAVDISPSMLEQLAQKPELAGKTEIFCQDILHEPLEQQADVIVSAMAAHHVEDTDALLQALFEHLHPGGKLALADLDAEDGSFHPPEAEGVFHAGFDRTTLAESARRAGFVAVDFQTACEVDRGGTRYPVFLLTASRPA